MNSGNIGSFWHELFRGVPLSIRITLVLIISFAALSIVFLVPFLILERQEDIEIGLKGFKATRPETTLEKNCRMATQEASVWSQSINSEILALESQVSIKDHDLSETRQKCLATLTNITRTQNESRCRTEVSQFGRLVTTFAVPRGDYETELTNIAEERNALQLRIAAKEQERAQWRQRLNQRCLGTEAHEPTAQTHGP